MPADRRTFVKTLGAATLALGGPAEDAIASLAAAQKPAVPVRFGVDMYSLQAQKWTPFQQMDFAAKWKVKVVHFSEIRFLGNLEPDNLRKVRARADELGLDLEIGMRSICPTSAMFDKAQGTAEEQLGRMVDAAKIVRSPIVRAVLGSGADRRGGIEKHIDSMVAVLKNARVEGDGCRRQGGDREPRRRHAGARAENARRSRRPGLRRRLHRLGQSRVDDRGSAPDARDARARTC